MVEETAARIEQMEKSQQELREILVRDFEQNHEQMAQMMQIIIRIAREKRTVDHVGFVNTVAQTQRATEGLMNPLANSINPNVGASHHSILPLTNVNPKIHPPPLL